MSSNVYSVPDYPSVVCFLPFKNRPKSGLLSVDIVQQVGEIFSLSSEQTLQTSVYVAVASKIRQLQPVTEVSIRHKHFYKAYRSGGGLQKTLGPFTCTYVYI